MERTEVKAVQHGLIDTIYFKEGEKVERGVVILIVKDFVTDTKLQFSKVEARRINEFMNDLRILTNSSLADGTVRRLKTMLYKEQLNRYLNQLAEQKGILAKANKEHDLYGKLRKEGVISEKEFFDYENTQQRALANYDAFIRTQRSQWYQQLAEYESQLNQLQQQKRLTIEDAKTYEVKAPVSGVIQGMNTIYTGGVLTSGESICSISPESDLIAECYVTAKEIGLVQLQQSVIYQIDAFDYNLFGTLGGKVISIDNDYTMMQNTPVFRVRCSFDTTVLMLKNGYTGHLKKGLTFQSRFVIGKRTLWELLWDKMDDWLNPVAPEKN